MRRQDHPGGVIEIQHDGVTDKWLVVRKVLTEANKVMKLF